jgi:hypothetical protein
VLLKVQDQASYASGETTVQNFIYKFLTNNYDHLTRLTRHEDSPLPNLTQYGKNGSSWLVSKFSKSNDNRFNSDMNVLQHPHVKEVMNFTKRIVSGEINLSALLTKEPGAPNLAPAPPAPPITIDISKAKPADPVAVAAPPITIDVAGFVPPTYPGLSQIDPRPAQGPVPDILQQAREFNTAYPQALLRKLPRRAKKALVVLNNYHTPILANVELVNRLAADHKLDALLGAIGLPLQSSDRSSWPSTDYFELTWPIAVLHVNNAISDEMVANISTCAALVNPKANFTIPNSA